MLGQPPSQKASMINAQLKKFKNVHVKPEWVLQCCQFLQKDRDINALELLELVYQQFLVADMTQIGVARLPQGIVDIHNQVISGSHVLQINELCNISEPLESRYEDTTGRMLKLSLTDGGQIFYALEYRRIPQLSVIKTHPGTKILISNVTIKRGMLLLTPENITILGGGVSELIEKYSQVRKQSVKNLLPQEWMDELGEYEVPPTQPSSLVPDDQMFEEEEQQEQDYNDSNFTILPKQESQIETSQITYSPLTIDLSES